MFGSTLTVLSSPSPDLIGGLTGRSSNHRPWILDYPVKHPIKSGEGNDKGGLSLSEKSLDSHICRR